VILLEFLIASDSRLLVLGKFVFMLKVKFALSLFIALEQF